jgi:predicted lipid-binding transport protein (Tim44 family)
VLKRLRRMVRSRRVRRGAADPDLAAFLDVARRSFVCMQQAWDRADLAALSAVATEPLLQELKTQLEERGPAPNHTEVLRIEARLLAVEELCEAQVASVEFSGLIREQLGARPTPFRELWMLARTAGADRAWRVARVQALS